MNVLHLHKTVIQEAHEFFILIHLNKSISYTHTEGEIFCAEKYKINYIMQNCSLFRSSWVKSRRV